MRVEQADAFVQPRAAKEDEAARNGADQRVPAAVVGVLAEDLEPPRHPPGLFGRTSREGRERAGDGVVEIPRAHGIRMREAKLQQPVVDRMRGHGCGTSADKRRDTSAASARCDRSRTGPAAGSTLKRTPW